MAIEPKTTREHIISLYGYVTGLKKDVRHMHKGIHELGGKIDKIYWVLLGTVGAVSLVLLERLLDIKDLYSKEGLCNYQNILNSKSLLSQ